MKSPRRPHERPYRWMLRPLLPSSNRCRLVDPQNIKALDFSFLHDMNRRHFLWRLFLVVHGRCFEFLSHWTLLASRCTGSLLLEPRAITLFCSHRKPSSLNIRVGDSFTESRCWLPLGYCHTYNQLSLSKIRHLQSSMATNPTPFIEADSWRCEVLALGFLTRMRQPPYKPIATSAVGWCATFRRLSEGDVEMFPVLPAFRNYPLASWTVVAHKKTSFFKVQQEETQERPFRRQQTPGFSGGENRMAKRGHGYQWSLAIFTIRSQLRNSSRRPRRWHGTCRPPLGRPWVGGHAGDR